MDTTAIIEELERFRDTVVAWRNADSSVKARLRTEINQNKKSAVRWVAEAGCHKTLTIGPPPAVGGLVMRGVDPFDSIFEPPYLTSLIPYVVDMCDEAIGVYRNWPEEPEVSSSAPSITTEQVRKGFVFVAMPIDPLDAALEDVLDAIKTACDKCGLTAERVDEAHSNEQITDRILESIEMAEYVIVDLTHARPNVFYEAGYAQGQRKTPIYIARSGTKLEFDLKDYPVIFFDNLKQLKEKLEARLRGLAASSNAP